MPDLVPPTPLTPKPPVPGWLLASLEGAGPLEAGVPSLRHVFNAAHNEMVAGGGTTAPPAVSQALFDYSEEIFDACTAKVAAKEAEAKRAEYVNKVEADNAAELARRSTSSTSSSGSLPAA
jgi:hypothetical protein